MMTKNLKTAGMTTTGTRGQEENDTVVINGVKVNVKPKPLVQKHSSEKKPEQPEGS